MQITIVSPLFPPDVAVPAPYVKELATRLAATDSVSILTYSHLPETITGVTIEPIEKQHILPLRLFRFFYALHHQLRRADVAIIQNGISSELPALICSLFHTTPLVLEVSDPKAAIQNERSWLKRLIHTLLVKRATMVITHTEYQEALSRPEVFSFAPYPTAAMHTYEATWLMHLTRLKDSYMQYDK